MSFAIGESIGHYEIVEELGAGANGRVLKVQHLITRRREAMKVLVDNKPDSPEQAQRFLREIRLQASLDHPGIAAVHNAFWLGDDLVMIMELIEGQTLATLLEHRRFSLEQSLTIIRQVLEALAYAHSHGVVHRDVSPNNIIVNAQGKVKLTDFGLAKGVADPALTEMGGMYGSPFYISPEQVRGTAEVDARSDVYSTAVVLYELLTGTRPFIAPSSFLLMQAHVQQVPEPPIFRNSAIPQYLNAAILKAMSKNPADRFQSTLEFLAAVDGPQAAPSANPRAAAQSKAPAVDVQPNGPVAALEAAPEAEGPNYSFLEPQSFEGIEFESVTNKPWSTPVPQKTKVAPAATAPVWWKSPWFGVALGLVIAAAIIFPMLSMLEARKERKAAIPNPEPTVWDGVSAVQPAPAPAPAPPELVRGPRLDPAQPPSQQPMRSTKKTVAKTVEAAPKPAPVMRIWGVDADPAPPVATKSPAALKADTISTPASTPKFEEPPSFAPAPAAVPSSPLAVSTPEIKDGPPPPKKKGFFRTIGRGIKSLVPDKDKKDGDGN
jgi:serine/threonine-protein kinase